VAVKRANRQRIAGSLLAVPVIIAVALLTAQPEAIRLSLLRLAAAALTAAGITLRLWALGSIGGNKKRVLVTWGPYRYLRHPLYTGSALLGCGFAAAGGSLLAAVLGGLLFWALYFPAVRAEERFLAVRFGPEWRAYCARTGRFVPKLCRYSPGGGAGFRLERPLRDIGALLLGSLVALAVAMLAREAHAALDLPGWFF
jgi:protein-S-isoprenylcysteine O-methyltransferase Ste14